MNDDRGLSAGAGVLPAQQAAHAPADPLASTNRKNAWRLLPLLFVGYVLSTLDKSNVGFAALEMNKALGFTPAVFGLGASLFFITYTIFEVPSNILLRRFGARLWLSRILITWGLVSMLTAFTHNQATFYCLRLALGIAEAGWFPGVVFYLCLWFPRHYRARAMTFFYLGSPFSVIIGYPISGMLLSLPRMMGIANWQWMFILEGIPTVLLGFALIALLKDRPGDAHWLDHEEKQALTKALDSERPTSEALHGLSALKMIANPKIALFGLINFLIAIGLYGIIIWIPQFIKRFGNLTNIEIGFISAIPFIFSSVALVLCAYSSDKRRERKWHVSGMMLLGALAMASTALTDSLRVSMVCLTFALIGLFGVYGTWFAMVTESLGHSSRNDVSLATGLAVITALGNLGGFVGPYGIGLFVSALGNFKYALLAVSLMLLIASLLIVACKRSYLEPKILSGSSVAHR